MCAVKLYLGVVWLGCREGTGRLEEREWGFAEKLAGIRVGEGDARSLTRVLFPPVRLITFLGTKYSLASNLTELPLNTRGVERERQAKERSRAPGADEGL